MHTMMAENHIIALLDMSRSLLEGVPFSQLYNYDLMDNTENSIFLKDKHSNFIGCNKKFAVLGGEINPNGVISRCDYDLVWKDEESDKYRTDDSEVISLSKPKLNIEETQFQSNGKSAIILTSKFPIFSSDKTLKGLIGISTDITMQKMLERKLLEISNNITKNQSIPEEFIGMELIESINKLQQTLAQVNKEGKKYVIIHNKRRVNLTGRQLQCLILLLQGKSNKQMGKELNLSHRTIESYLNYIKDKFGCPRKNELINIILSSTGFIDNQYK